MKIAIPVDEQNLDSGVCPSFGRAPYFLFYNTDTKESY
jgi:predicted Fe-Mo cluster-binding NifX family protein